MTCDGNTVVMRASVLTSALWQEFDGLVGTVNSYGRDHSSWKNEAHFHNTLYNSVSILVDTVQLIQQFGDIVDDTTADKEQGTVRKIP